jgi:CRISPR-associated endonuclease Cas2
MLGRNSFKNANDKGNFNASVRRLIDNSLIKFEDTSQGRFLRLTEKGEQKLRQLENYNYQIEKPKKWDKRWRIIIFDIKEGRKGTREKLRLTLKSIGFVRLQNSVWVYPYDCEDLITLLKADFKIGKDVLYVIAEKIENDKWLKQEFNLI